MISPFPATTKCPKITDDLQGVGEWEPFPEPNEGPYGPQLTPKQVATSDNEHYQNMINEWESTELFHPIEKSTLAAMGPEKLQQYLNENSGKLTTKAKWKIQSVLDYLNNQQ